MLTNFLALDVGRARIGLAMANDSARIAAPLPAISNDENCFNELKRVVQVNEINRLIVGWPRGLSGQETEQTRYVADFIVQLERATSLPITRQDEAVTSVKAEAELAGRKKTFDKADIDSLSAVYILEDYLNEELH